MIRLRSGARRVGRVPLAAALGAVVTATACDPAPAESEVGPVTDEVYVRVMTDLMVRDTRARRDLGTEEAEARSDSARRAILAEYGVTAGEVLDFVRATGGEAARMQRLWEEIADRFDSVRVADAAAAGAVAGDSAAALEPGAYRDSGSASAAPVRAIPGARDGAGDPVDPALRRPARRPGRGPTRRPPPVPVPAADTTIPDA